MKSMAIPNPVVPSGSKLFSVIPLELEILWPWWFVCSFVSFWPWKKQHSTSCHEDVSYVSWVTRKILGFTSNYNGYCTWLFICLPCLPLQLLWQLGIPPAKSGEFHQALHGGRTSCWESGWIGSLWGEAGDGTMSQWKPGRDDCWSRFFGERLKGLAKNGCHNSGWR